MTRVRHQLLRRAAIGFVLALLLVPIALSGHHHGDGGGTHPCAACTVAHHVPVLAPAVAAIVAVGLPCGAPASSATAALASGEHRAHGGRAPPLSFPVDVA